MTEVPGRNRTGHGGTIHAVVRQTSLGQGEIIDFSANINPLGAPAWLRPLVSRELSNLQHYPDPEYPEFIAALGEWHGVDPAMVVPGNGSTELLYVLPRILDCQRALIPVPSYSDYRRSCQLAGLAVELVPLSETDDFRLDMAQLAAQIRPGDLVILATPNNPTGALVEAKEILQLAAAFPQSHFLIDEAFLDFIEGATSVAGQGANILTLHSMTKFFAIPGLRLGFGIFPVPIAERMRAAMPPWTVNHLAQAVGRRAMADLAYQTESRALCTSLRTALMADLAAFPTLKVYPGTANYLLLRLPTGQSVIDLARQLLAAGILIRCCDNYPGLDDRYFRVAVRTEAENNRLVQALSAVLTDPLQRPKPAKSSRKTPALMFQGTSSNAGKSILTAALCRILLQDGVRVAPFKAQNMSLNSGVTRRGEEMGRAQVVQAQAAKIDADVRMNPILLKPNSDTGSQIIVCGYPVGNMSVNKYASYKPEAWQQVCRSYDSLSCEYQAIILEGAGSPGEVNLKHDDLVNMKMARYAEAPVLLVGDIDRGGVYASFVGTMEVLNEWERRLIAGFIVNRFRGQASLLASAHRYVLEHCDREVWGVIPYIHDLGLPEEDSVSFKGGSFSRPRLDTAEIIMAVVNLPHIANFTDIEPFLAEPDVHLRIVDSPAELADADIILLPGSKNVMGDLAYIDDKGFAAAIRRLAALDVEIVGICGGYQILGRSVADPHHLESTADQRSGLGLLDLTTELQADKTLVRRQGIHLPSGLAIRGYEIHHGTSATNLAPLLRFSDGATCGATNGATIWGSYLHGIFDDDAFRRWFIDQLRIKKGLAPIGEIVAPYDLEVAFDRLADTVRANINMERIHALLRL